MREIVAIGFDGVGKTLDGFSSLSPLVTVGAGMARAIGALVRNVGVQSAADDIAELVRRRDEGKISGDDVRADNESIVDAVASLYTEDEDTK